MSRDDSGAPPQANPDVRRPRRRGPGGPVGYVLDAVLMGWRWLVRMRTALLLLGLLALLTAVATAVPQEPNVPSTVASWRTGESGPGAGAARVLDAVGAFDVYGSPAFLALLLALFLSLTACLVPRIRAWVRLVRRSRPPLLRHGAPAGGVVARLVVAQPPAEALSAAATLLSERRWRVRRGGAADAATEQVAAEKGLWSREGGSLLFHLSFYLLLASIVFGQLATFEGQRGVVEREPGFTDTEVSYWNYRPGRWFAPQRHQGWRLELDDFHVDWIRDPLAPGAGQPTVFRSDVTITPTDGTAPFTAVVEGNKPLVIDGTKIHQLDWGYAVRVEIVVDGEVVHDAFVTMVESGGFFRGAAKAPAADPDVGLSLFLFPFAPPHPTDPQGEPRLTGAPWADAPLLVIEQWRGDLLLGVTQQLVTELDTSELRSEGGAFLRPGEQVEIEGVTVRFPELRRWVGFQVSRRPQIPWLLASGALLSAGLVFALYAYRRRLWVTGVRAGKAGHTLLTVSGRAFQRPEVFEQEHARLVAALASRLGGVPPEDPGPEGAGPEDPGPEDSAAVPVPAPADDTGSRASATPTER